MAEREKVTTRCAASGWKIFWWLLELDEIELKKVMAESQKLPYALKSEETGEQVWRRHHLHQQLPVRGTKQRRALHQSSYPRLPLLERPLSRSDREL